jgi:hypothetical protein
MLFSVDASGALLVVDVDDVVSVADGSEEVDDAEVDGAEVDGVEVDGADAREVGTAGGFAEVAMSGEAPELLAHATTPNERRGSAIVLSTRRPKARTTLHIGFSSA